MSRGNVKKKKAPFMLRLVQWSFPALERIFPALARRFFVTIFFTPLNYSVPPKEQEAGREAEKFRIHVKGKKIQCYSWGEGPAVVVVHGWAGRATQFRKFITPLREAGYRVVGFDGPAHGQSDGRKTNILEFEETFRALFQKIGTPEAFIAHSFGGAAVLFSAMNGLPVKKLITIASPTIGDEIINTYLRTIGGSAATGNAFKDFILKTTGKPFDQFTSRYFIQRIENPPDLLLVHDEDDDEVYLSHALEMKKLHPPTQLMVTRGLGHTRILKDEPVIRACVTFIQEGRLTL